MGYRPSIPLRRWLGDRRAAIVTLEGAHASTSRSRARPLAHAYVLRVVAEFQAYVRELHDLAAIVLVTRSGAEQQLQDLLAGAVTRGRGIDRGNADVRTVQSDFRRLGLESINAQIGAQQPHWKRGDQRRYTQLIELRNALAHGNSTQLAELRARGVLDTLTWSRSRLPGLDRIARAMDRVVWDHLVENLNREPWEG